jgi:N,N'-diacetyllegionaminate synthase
MAKNRKPIILSTGMSDLRQVSGSVRMLRKAKSGPVIVTHCTTAYPTADKDVNLRAMLTMGRELNVPVGYSDHTPGSDVAIAAVALGACVIEKHITLDKKLSGPDHFASLEPDAFAGLVRSIRRVERIMGDGKKDLTAGERVIAKVARKSIVAARPLRKGTRITEDDFSYKRPGTGLPPMEADSLIGKRLRRDVDTDTILKRSDFI